MTALREMSPEAWEGAKLFAGIVTGLGIYFWVHLARRPNRKCGTCGGSGRRGSAWFPSRWGDCPDCGGKGDHIKAQ